MRRAESRYPAHILPFSATFTCHLEQAEVLYEGNHRTLVGLKTFVGSKGNKTPQHAVLRGMSDAGKSVTLCVLLSEEFYEYTVIIEEGLFYEIYTRTVAPDARPIIIHPDGDLTINYLDTPELPLLPWRSWRRSPASAAMNSNWHKYPRPPSFFALLSDSSSRTTRAAHHRDAAEAERL
jgi:hypothetical protein